MQSLLNLAAPNSHVVRDVIRSVGYTDEPVVVDFSIDIPAGSITTIIGPNGAGKSTLLDAISGRRRPTGGRVRYQGADITGRSVAWRRD